MKLSRFTKYKYPEPERYSPEVARERKLAGALQASYQDRERLERVRNEALSQVRKKTVNLSRTIVKERPVAVPKAASIAAALAQFSERDFANPEKRAAYRALRAQQEGLRNVQAAASDKRRFNPMGEHGFASTIYGTLVGKEVINARGPRLGWVPNVRMPTSVVPCIQRAVRREVMFALGLAGRGYHKKKRRTESSGIPC